MHQYESSITHRSNLERGLTVTQHREVGEGDDAVSLVRYSDGSTWTFDNAAGTQLHYVYGYRCANHSQEPAWFLTEGLAREFNARCGFAPDTGFGDPEIEDADRVDLTDILL